MPGGMFRDRAGRRRERTTCAYPTEQWVETRIRVRPPQHPCGAPGEGPSIGGNGKEPYRTAETCSWRPGRLEVGGARHLDAAADHARHHVENRRDRGTRVGLSRGGGVGERGRRRDRRV